MSRMKIGQENGMRAALLEIMNERRRQHGEWGEQNHDLSTWLMILGEEVGELNQAVFETYYSGPHGGIGNIREEAVQVAAVACQSVEYIDRSVHSETGEDRPNEPDS